MFYICDNTIEDIINLNHLKNSMMQSDDQFEQWNTTSLNHLHLAGIGLNGYVAHLYAILLLERFIKWRAIKPDDYVPSIDDISKKLERIKNISYTRLIINKIAYSWGMSRYICF